MKEYNQKEYYRNSSQILILHSPIFALWGSGYIKKKRKKKNKGKKKKYIMKYVLLFKIKRLEMK